jgi:hypothetical protein
MLAAANQGSGYPIKISTRFADFSGSCAVFDDPFPPTIRANSLKTSNGSIYHDTHIVAALERTVIEMPGVSWVAAGHA